MDAAPLLVEVARALEHAGLDAVLIGNAAAALQGAPVTTGDFDFMFRATPGNLAKLKKFARRLEAVILRPYFPASALFRVMNDDRGLQADFMTAIHGVKSFNRLRSRAERIDLGGHGPRRPPPLHRKIGARMDRQTLYIVGDTGVHLEAGPMTELRPELDSEEQIAADPRFAAEYGPVDVRVEGRSGPLWLGFHKRKDLWWNPGE